MSYWKRSVPWLPHYKVEAYSPPVNDLSGKPAVVFIRRDGVAVGVGASFGSVKAAMLQARAECVLRRKSNCLDTPNEGPWSVREELGQ